MLALPLFVLLAMLSALAVGIWLAALNAKYRDFRYMVPFALTAWMFLTPVIYPATAITSRLPEAWRWLYHLNPMTGVVEGFRWALLGGNAFSADMLLVSTGVVLVVFVAGLFYFRKMERVFADLL
jgi:lipopolysaccharide transport system permease protein